MYSEPLLKIWCEVLQLDRVAHDESFFVLGGDSIKAITMSRRILAELGHDVPVIDIFRYPTIQALGAALEARIKAELSTGAILPAPVRPSYPLSAVQREFYLLERMTRRGESAVSTTVIHFDSGLSWHRSFQAFRRLLERHEVLRTAFHLVGSTPMQTVRPVDDVLAGFQFSDLSSEAGAEEHLQQIYEDGLTQPFDLSAGLVVRLHVCKVASDRTVALLSLHHIAADGFSAAILEKEFRAFYAADAEGEYSTPLSFHYKDYAHWLENWLNSHAGKKARDYWRSAFVNYRKQEFPAQLLSPHAPSFAAAREDLLIEPAVCLKLRQIGAKAEATSFVILQSCIKVFIHLETGSNDIVTGSPVTVRDAIELSNQVGPYLNTLPIRTSIDSDDTFYEIAKKVNDATLAAYTHKLVPLDIIAAEAGHATKLFDVGFTLQNQNRAQPKEGSCKVTAGPTRPAEHSEHLTVKMWFVASERADDIEVDIHHQKAAFDRDTVCAMKHRLQAVIAAVAQAPDVPLQQLFPLHEQTPVDTIELDLNS